MRTRVPVPAIALLAAVAACGASARSPNAPSPAPLAEDTSPDGGTLFPSAITPAHLLPELSGTRGVVASESGDRRMLLDRLRLMARSDGSIERATQLFPAVQVSTVALPSRLGGGYMFYASQGGGTDFWYAKSWLGKLEPVVHRTDTVVDVTPGFDRLYLRISGNQLVAMDPRTADPKPLGALPPAANYGQLAFADGWRAVVDTDLRGPLTTFDAGATWRPVGITDRVRGIGILGGDPAVLVQGGSYSIDARGTVTYRTESSSRGDSNDDKAAEARRLAKHRPGASAFGKSVVRAAVEDGWPVGPTSAVVARAGALARVSLTDGSIEAIAENAFPDDHISACHAVRLGIHDIGFVCGEPNGATTIYEYVPPLSMKSVLRFAQPRFVASSGNGALVMRGSCSDSAPTPSDDSRPYCVRSPDGHLRDLHIKGEAGFERIVGLGDGRIAVLVPPRNQTAGTLTVVSGSTSKDVTLTLPKEPATSATELRRGLWLEGFEERAPGVLGGWVESGGPLVGIEVDLDGKVTAGPLRDDAGIAVICGRFGISVIEGGRGAETTDGGKTWTVFTMPERPVEARAFTSRGCSPAGAALPGWVRAGWGEPTGSEDMAAVESPKSRPVPLRVAPLVALTCDVESTATPPLPEAPKKPPPGRPAPPPRSRGVLSLSGVGSAPPQGHETPRGWTAFRNTPPPALADGDYGIEGETGSDLVRLQAYAWGRKGSDWTRAGRWLMRFDDRFDAAGGLRSTVPSPALWADETAAVEAIGYSNNYGSVSWAAYLDPGGRAAIAAACHGSQCTLYSAVEGAPVLPFRDSAGRPATFLRPVPNGAVRLGETWFFLTHSSSSEPVALMRVDLGVPRQVGTYYRPIQRYSYESPRLVRRATTGSLGLLVVGPPEPGERAGSFYVFPVNTETGDLGEAQVLARRDLIDAVKTQGGLPACGPLQDGWLVDTALEVPPAIDLENAATAIDGLEFRLRIDPQTVCVEASSGRASALFPRATKGATAPPAQAPLTSPPAHKGSGRGFPMAVTERTTGRRWGLRCELSGSLATTPH